MNDIRKMFTSKDFVINSNVIKNISSLDITLEEFLLLIYFINISNDLNMEDIKDKLGFSDDKIFNTFKNNSSSSNSSSNNFNLDAETLMKMTSVINAMNQKDNPGSNLLHSLKPYLRDSRKDKLDQYANLLNLTKIADVMKNDNKENNNA